MLRHNNLDSEKTLDEKTSNSPDRKIRISIILDPNIFFITYNGKFIIHPIIQAWLDEIRNNPDYDQPHVYMLAHAPNSSNLFIVTDPLPYTIKVDQILFDMLTKDSLEYIIKLWNGRMHFATFYENSHIGISDFSDEYQFSKEEILIITADRAMSEFFKNKHISVAMMDMHNYPVLSAPLIPPGDKDKFEIYCDFDGTLFNFHHFLALHRFKEMRLTTTVPKEDETLNALLSEQSMLELLQNNTISFLQTLHGHPEYLITQRHLETDEKQPRHNSAKKLIPHINTTYNLCIQSDDSSFLNAQANEKENKKYPKKIKVIYDRIKERPENMWPKHLLLLDDNIMEIFACEEGKPYFETLGIELTMALILHPVHFSNDLLGLFKEHSPCFYEKILQIYQLETAKITSALECIKEKQNDIAIAAKRNFLFSNLQVTTPTIEGPTTTPPTALHDENPDRSRCPRSCTIF